MLPSPKRLLSIDVFRSVNMFFMIFVNDLSGVRNVPEWIDHVKGYEDGMHFADSIFPLFLFIAGLSIPLAIGRRLDKGDSFMSIAGYILLRSFALIVMGFFHVNMEDYAKEAVLPLGVWELLLTIAFFLIWLDYPETLAKTKKYILMGLGVAILIALAILYKGGTPDHPKHLSPEWWGILGIIGWAYLVCSGLYLVLKGNFTLLVASAVLFIAINIAVHAKLIHFNIWVINDGSSAALMMFGAVFSMLYAQFAAKDKYNYVWILFTLKGIALIGLGFILRPYTQGISKIHSTPAWVLICTGIGVLLFEFFIWLIDKDGHSLFLKKINIFVSAWCLKFTSNENFVRLLITIVFILVDFILLYVFVSVYNQNISESLYSNNILGRWYANFILTLRTTSSWAYVSLVIVIISLEFFVVMVNVKNKIRWFKIIKPAGTSTLTCYLIPYLMVAIFYITNFNYPHIFNYGTGGIIRSFAVCFIVIFITGFLEKRRLRLKI